MTAHGTRITRAMALAGLASLCWTAFALAQTTTDVTKVSGTSTGTGRILRTIIDAQPNSQGDGILATHSAGCTVTPGMTASQIAAAYRDSLNFYLTSVGYKAYFSPAYSTTDVRLTRASNQNFTSSEVNPVPGNTTTPRALTVEDAPIASPTALALLLAGFTTLAWWARRRRRLA